MSIAPDFLTWDGDGGSNLPRRPSTDDLGGDKKEDDAENPPDDGTMPTAAGWNQLVRQVAALSKMVPACTLEVQFVSGTPVVTYTAARSTPITFTPTDNGVGDTSITWPANTFPPASLSPSGFTLLSNAAATTIDGHVEVLTNGIRVRTRSGGAAADIPFTIHIN